MIAIRLFTFLWEIRQFYLYFPDEQIVRTLSALLTWYHFQRVSHIKYLPYLPTEEELIHEIEREKLIIKDQLQRKHG